MISQGNLAQHMGTFGQNNWIPLKKGFRPEQQQAFCGQSKRIQLRK